MSDALCIDNLWWRYPTYSDEANPWVLRDVSLQVERGACFGITGPGGAGKTTLCRSILGIIPHNARLTAEQLPHHFRGFVSIYGEPVTAAAPVTSHIGMVLQDPENQFLRMSLLHELALGLQISGLSNDEILARIHEALTMVGLEHLWYGAAYIHPADLSGGQKQRVAIAAFLAMRPRVLVLDEPTSDLDPAGKREIIKTIARLREQEGMTIILVEQDPDILATFCDTIALLHEGRVELVAPPADFYAHRELIERTGTAVGELPRISWHSGYTFEGRPPLTIEEGVVAFGEGMMEEWMITDGEAAPCGRPSGPIGEMGGVAPSERSSDNGPIITAENVCYQYVDGTEALEGIDLSIYRGEMVALLGPNGSGKTTLARILAGIYPASRGRVEVLGQDLAKRRVRAQLARSVGYVFQNPDHQLFRRKVRDEIAYGLKNLGIDGVRRRTIIEETLEAVQLARYADEDPLFLSKGQRQRLAVAAVLAMGPEILIVDEPTTGQDFRSVQAIMRLLLNLQQQGKTILIITHDMSLVAEYCQRAVAFRDGSIVFTGAPRELFSDADALHRTGLRQPTAAALSTRLREQQPGLPFLMTVQEWTKALLSLEKRR